jgi:hypothetical protein
MSDKGLKSIAFAGATVGLAWLGFENNSAWAFVGSVLAFLSI